MNWDDFDAFCHVVEHGGFTAAAKALDRPKSGVSAAVARLEAALSARLLERTTRRLRLTEAGEALHHAIGPLFRALREARAEAVAQRDSVVGTLRIAAPYEFGSHHLGPVACELMAAYPRLKVQIDVEHRPVDLLERRYDIAFAMLDTGLPASSMVVRRMFSLERGVYAAPRLLDGRAEPARLEDLGALPLLRAAGDTEWSFTAPDGRLVTLTATASRLDSSNADLRLQAAIAGLGVARITATFCAEAVRDGRLRRLLPDHVCAPLRVYALLPAKRLMPARVRLFLDALGAQAGVSA